MPSCLWPYAHFPKLTAPSFVSCLPLATSLFLWVNKLGFASDIDVFSRAVSNIANFSDILTLNIWQKLVVGYWKGQISATQVVQIIYAFMKTRSNITL